MSEYYEHDSMDDEQREQEMQNNEEYRRPPYMRDAEDNGTEEPEGSASYSYDSSTGRSSYGYDDGKNRYAYDDQGSEPSGSRYSYDEESRYRAKNGGNGGNRPKKSNGKVIAAVVVAALAIGGVVGGASYVIGNYFNNHQLGAAMAPATQEAQAETEAAQAGTEAAKAESESSERDVLLPGTGLGESIASQEGASSNESAAQAAEGSENASIETATAGASQTAAVKALDVTDVVDVAMPSVVAITTTQIYEDYSAGGYNPFYYYFYGFDGGQGAYGNQGGQGNEYTVTGAGSGIIIGDDGEELWVVTNNHVVADAETLTISFADDTTAEAYVKGTDENNDLAVVGVKLSGLSDATKSSIKAIQMGDSDSLRLGETVIAIGNALGLGQSVSTGVVSAVNREITTSEGTTLNTIQTDAAINPGNSGGALLDANGELIGINVAKDAETEVEGMGYAIPISSAKSIIETLTSMSPREAVGEDQYPYMGVQLQDIDSTAAQYYNMPQGILVYSVVENGPAQKAGLLTQDIITEFNGVSVKTYDQLTNQLQYYAGGTTVTLKVQRVENGQYTEKELTMTLGLRKDYVNENQNQNGGQNNGNQQMPGNGGQQMPGNGGTQQTPGNGTQQTPDGGTQQTPNNGSDNSGNTSGWNGFNFGN